MENKEFDKKIKNELQEKLKVPQVVEEKLNETYKKIDSMKYKSKRFNFSKISQIAASLVVIVFLAGNGIAYARGRDNIYSWILNKIGIQKEYEEVKTEINQTAESNGIRITLLDCAYDSNRFIACYKVEDLEGKIKAINEKYQSKLTDNVSEDIYDSMFLEKNITFYTQNGQQEINPDADMGSPLNSAISKQISDTEFIIYDTVVLSERNWDGKLTNVDIDLWCISYLGYKDGMEGLDHIRGNWAFKVTELEDKYKDTSTCLLDVHKKIDNKNEFTVNSIRIENSGIIGNIFINYSINNEDEGAYIFRVINKNNEVLGEFYLSIPECGIEPIPYKYLSKLEDNEEYKIVIYRDENYDDIKAGKVQPIYTIPFTFENNIHNFQTDELDECGMLK